MADEGDPMTNETPRGDSEDEAGQQETDHGELEVVGEVTEDDQKVGEGEPQPQEVNGTEPEGAEETQETDRGDSEDDQNTEMPDQKTARVITQAELEGDTPPMRETTEEDSTLTPTHGVEMEMDSTNNEEVVGETEERLSEHNTAQESGDEIITEDLGQEAKKPPANIEEKETENC